MIMRDGRRRDGIRSLEHSSAYTARNACALYSAKIEDANPGVFHTVEQQRLVCEHSSRETINFGSFWLSFTTLSFCKQTRYDQIGFMAIHVL